MSPGVPAVMSQDAADNHFTEDQFEEMLHHSEDAAVTVAGAPSRCVESTALKPLSHRQHTSCHQTALLKTL